MKRWGGRTALAARTRLAHKLAAGDLICDRCGRVIRPDEPWDVGHITDQVLGGTHHPSNLRVEHSSCNRSAGATLRHTLKGAATKTRNRIREW